MCSCEFLPHNHWSISQRASLTTSSTPSFAIGWSFSEVGTFVSGRIPIGLISFLGRFDLVDCLHDYRTAVTIHGDDVLAHSNWEISESWLRKYKSVVPIIKLTSSPDRFLDSWLKRAHLTSWIAGGGKGVKLNYDWQTSRVLRTVFKDIRMKYDLAVAWMYNCRTWFSRCLVFSFVFFCYEYK